MILTLQLEKNVFSKEKTIRIITSMQAINSDIERNKLMIKIIYYSPYLE